MNTLVVRGDELTQLKQHSPKVKVVGWDTRESHALMHCIINITPGSAVSYVLPKTNVLILFAGSGELACSG